MAGQCTVASIRPANSKVAQEPADGPAGESATSDAWKTRSAAAPVRGRSVASARTVRQRGDSGTQCPIFTFIRSAGVFHAAAWASTTWAAASANAGLPVGQILDDLVELILQPFEREIVQELSPPQQSPVGIG